ncbi:hypothetical protein CRG98_047333 [Punica granatum]|uniref:Large ribosomal subunit protein uL15/eL18 domain-containing protein n=1 Tax=Punica granatum TaxID=22663 RepID=A0A2I0HKI7_PUNGR|nr:hypothetical protein CRG98_047333 [Punica granatum]
MQSKLRQCILYTKQSTEQTSLGKQKIVNISASRLRTDELDVASHQKSRRCRCVEGHGQTDSSSLSSTTARALQQLSISWGTRLRTRPPRTSPPIVDVSQFSYFKVLGKGVLPEQQPIVVKAKLISMIAEKKIKEASGAVILTA